MHSSRSPRALVPNSESPASRSAAEEAAVLIENEEMLLGQAPPGPSRVLMVATDFTTPYRVLRCARASGAEVYVLGHSGARLLRYSRYCARFFVSDCIIHGGRDEALALEINCLTREHGITVVVPVDAPATRALIANRDLIEAPCFPLPGLDQFDALNNKWTFSQLCKELAIRQPVTRLLPDAATLAHQIALGVIDYPLIAKPLGRSASGGVVILDGVDSERRLASINYKPVLVQKFVPGEDIGASVYAKAGKIEAFVAHWYRRGIYGTFHDAQIYSDIAKIMSRFDLDGVYNFDMILAADGSIYYLECNPRFFFKINLSMIAGINFVERGIPGAEIQGTGSIESGVQVRFPKALLRSLVSSGRCTKRDWAMLGYLFSDPWPFLMEKIKLTL
jgi:predicted ATP-grasp superfamily ATP-dependent carboligase